jgi:biopolymer transport protein ExbB/TolQ
MNSKAARPPGERLQRVGIGLLLGGPLLGLVMTVAGLVWSFEKVGSVNAANKAKYLADGIGTAMVYPTIIGGSLMVLGAVLVIAAALKARRARG